MKIVDLATFRAMPSGTVFQKFTPNAFEGLQILESAEGPDFVATDLCEGLMSGDDWKEADNKIRDMHENGASHPVSFDNSSRDGMFDRDQMFAVWSPEDVEVLMRRLEEAMSRQSEA